jgi:hypothetical protein
MSIRPQGSRYRLLHTNTPIKHTHTLRKIRYTDVYYIDSVMRTKAVVFRLRTKLIANR